MQFGLFVTLYYLLTAWLDPDPSTIISTYDIESLFESLRFPHYVIYVYVYI